jgi:hypothetical protein
LSIGQDGEAVVLQETPAVALADRAGPLQSVVAREIQLGGVVQEQRHRVAGHGLTGLLPVRALHGGQGGFLAVAQPIEPPQGVPVEDLGERLLGPGRDGGGRRDQTPRAPSVAEFDSAKVLRRPGARVRDDIHVYLGN